MEEDLKQVADWFIPSDKPTDTKKHNRNDK